MWFEKLVGFKEKSPEQVRSNITVNDGVLTSKVNGRSYKIGKLDTPTLAQLRQSVQSLTAWHKLSGKLNVSEVVDDVQRLHLDESNAGALFQVASQFNLLEMPAPDVTPEHGVDAYENDNTQAPICAVATGAATIYRNYFVPVNGKIGQSKDNQIDCLLDMGEALGNVENGLWDMKNGYIMLTDDGIHTLSNNLDNMNESERDALRENLRIGVLSNAEVTLSDTKHSVSQAYCAAIPIRYSAYQSDECESFARLILEAAYEATICTGILNAVETGNHTVYLTLVGGGVFGNKLEWIMDAIKRAVCLYQQVDLDIKIVSYGQSKKPVHDLVRNVQSFTEEGK